MEKKYITKKQLADATGTSVFLIDELLKKYPELPKVKFSKKYRYNVDDVIAFLQKITDDMPEQTFEEFEKEMNEQENLNE